MFLTKVECTAIIQRKWIPESERTKKDPGEKKWVRKEKSFTGYIVGERTLSNGYTEWQGENEGVLYSPHRYFKAYLVVFDLHNKPVHVLPEDINAK